MQFLTNGGYDPETALFVTREAARSTSSPPTTSSRPLLRGLRPPDLFDIVARHGLHFDRSPRGGSCST